MPSQICFPFTNEHTDKVTLQYQYTKIRCNFLQVFEGHTGLHGRFVYKWCLIPQIPTQKEPADIVDQKK